MSSCSERGNIKNFMSYFDVLEKILYVFGVLVKLVQISFELHEHVVC